MERAFRCAPEALMRVREKSVAFSGTLEPLKRGPLDRVSSYWTSAFVFPLWSLRAFTPRGPESSLWGCPDGSRWMRGYGAKGHKPPSSDHLKNCAVKVDAQIASTHHLKPPDKPQFCCFVKMVERDLNMDPIGSSNWKLT